MCIKMKKLIVLVLLLMAFVSVSICSASGDNDNNQIPQKKTVAFLFVNNGNTNCNDAVNKLMMKDIQDRLSGNYQLVDGDKYIERLNKFGISDISTAERSDIVQAFKNEHIDYVVYAEIQPVAIKHWISYFNQGANAILTVPFKIIDVSNDKYLYNGKFIKDADNSSTFGGVGTKAAVIAALDKVFVQMNEVLSARIPI
jgi:hypothetical protein